MASKKKNQPATVQDQIILLVEELVYERAAELIVQLRAELPDILAASMGLPTGDAVIANHVDRLVNKHRGPKPTKTTSGTKRGPGRPKGSKNKTETEVETEQASDSESHDTEGTNGKSLYSQLREQALAQKAAAE